MRPPRILVAVLVVMLAAGACATGSGSSFPSPDPQPTLVSSADQAARLAALRSPLLAGIGPLEPGVIGTASWWEATEVAGRGDDGGWQIVFRAGWGDCPAGCTDVHAWTYRVGRDGSVTFVGEDGPALPPELIDELRNAAAERERVVGIAGRASAGPTCPVERPGEPDCGPRSVAFATIVVRAAAGGEVARATTDEAGFFRIALGPGDYTVEAQPVEGLLGTPAPVPVTVQGGSEAWVDLAYDTGIR